jgi:hemerythrin-like domain-containing protein
MADLRAGPDPAEEADMTQTLPQATHEHHARLLEQIDRMPALADALLDHHDEAVVQEVANLAAFLTGTLLPHIDAAETTLYPELERMLQNRHSMVPMRREHQEVRRLAASFVEAAAKLRSGPVPVRSALALRRLLFQLYAILKIHLAEEEAYMRIVDHGVAADAGEMLAAALDHPTVRG